MKFFCDLLLIKVVTKYSWRPGRGQYWIKHGVNKKEYKSETIVLTYLEQTSGVYKEVYCVIQKTLIKGVF